MIPMICEIAGQLCIPAEWILGIMEHEMAMMNVLDVIADRLVILYWRGWHLQNRLHVHHNPEWKRHGMIRNDSSTGYGQIFARTAMEALNFARRNQIYDPQRTFSSDNPEDMWYVWNRLRTDRRFNVLVCGLCLIHAGTGINETRPTQAYTPDEVRKMFSRYNAKTATITEYGKEVYRISMNWKEYLLQNELTHTES